MRYFRLAAILTLALLAAPWQHARLAHAEAGEVSSQESQVLLVIAGDPLTNPGYYTLGDERQGGVPPGIGGLEIGDLVSPWDAVKDEDGKPIPATIRFYYLSVDRHGNTIGRLCAISGGVGVGERYVVPQGATREKPQPSKVLQLALKRLQQTLQAIHQANLKPLQENLDRAEQRFHRAAEEAARHADEMQSTRRQLIQADAVPEGLNEQLLRLKQDHLTLQVDLAGLAARRRVILEHIERTRAELQDTKGFGEFLSMDPILRQLPRQVILQQQQVELAADAASRREIGKQEVNKAKILLAQLNADLEKRCSELQTAWAARQIGTGQLSKLNEQLVEVQIAIAAAEAQEEVIGKVLSQLESREVQGLVDQYREASTALQYAQSARQATAEDVLKAEDALRAVREPKITVIQQPGKSK